jgi:hypothetical protein
MLLKLSSKDDLFKLYVESISLLNILDYFNPDIKLELLLLYGEKGDNIISNQDGLEIHIENIKQLRDYLTFENKDPIFIVDIVFRVDNIKFSIHDEYALTIELEYNKSSTINTFLDYLKIDEEIITKELFNNINNYVLVNSDSKIIKVFHSFDEYLSSSYSS